MDCDEVFTNDEYKRKFWHSSSHILAAALKELYGDSIKLGTGPAIENGFYYDFDLGSVRVDIDSFSAIEKKFIEICQRNDKFLKKNISKQCALDLFKDNEYKSEIINELQDGEITVYTNGNFTDLCKGPHIECSGLIKAVKILNVAGAYWRGNENNKQMTRIYGISFPDESMLKEYLDNIEEAKKRDHQKIGRSLKFFTFSEKVGIGLPLWLPRGTVYRDQLVNFLKDQQIRAGYKQVITPHIGNKNLYVTSGHYDKYGDDSFKPIKTPNDGEEYFLKPMNCPHHCEIYKSEIRSYRDLPLRLAEFGTVYRYEQHGELHGLSRTRCFTQDDAHIFCRKSQVESEFSNVIDLIQICFKKLGFDDFVARLSLRDQKDHSKYIGDMCDWDIAEQSIESVATNKGLEITKAYGEAAFYGPKLDFIIKDALGRNWQLGTVQLDYQLPIRFELFYINENNEREIPVMIHRAPFGSIERITSILLEHTAGKLPLWLSPEQAIILPISGKVLDYSKSVANILLDNKIRTVIDDRNEKINRKIRDAELMKIPYFVVVGEKEMNDNTITVRRQGENCNQCCKIGDFIDIVRQQLISN